MNDSLPVLAEVKRGSIIESRHRGAIIIVTPDGRAVAELGDRGLITSTRSTIKPFQAIPFITSGAADRFGATERELALVCASHEGEPIHTETGTQMLERAGLDESALRCGSHAPFNSEAAQQLEREGVPFTQIHNNCSGKHAAMLLTAAHRGLAVEDYTSPDHPVQREIISVFARLSDLDDNLPTAIDGCSAPTFGVPLGSVAKAFARLVNPSSIPNNIAQAASRLVRAMVNYPEMVGGTKRFDTDLLRAARGKLVCKVGAEAVYGIGVLPSERFPQGLGIAIKMEDGSYRGLGPAVVETLAQLGVLEASEQQELARYHRPAIENRRSIKVGEVLPVFNLGIDKQ
jgi:L-asparaginase II